MSRERIVNHGLLGGVDDEPSSPPEANAHHGVEGSPEQTGAEAQLLALRISLRLQLEEDKNEMERVGVCFMRQS